MFGSDAKALNGSHPCVLGSLIEAGIQLPELDQVELAVSGQVQELRRPVESGNVGLRRQFPEARNAARYDAAIAVYRLSALRFAL